MLRLKKKSYICILFRHHNLTFNAMLKSLQKLLFSAMLLAAPWAVQGQTLADYSYSTGADSAKWIDMSAATTILAPSGNDGLASGVQAIGFAFPFGQEEYTQYSVNTDGNLRLGAIATGTSNYGSPFSSTNANTNNPKINFFGCDGYGVYGLHYAKALNTVDGTGNSLLSVEFCTGTYNSTTRNNLYLWQVHLYPNGNIEVVYGPAPASGPDAARQQGLCVDAADGWTVDTNHAATHFEAGTDAAVAAGFWPDEWRYYRFDAPAYACPKPLAISINHLGSTGFDISWVDTSDAQQWIVRLRTDDSIVSSMVANAQSASFSGLHPASQYTVEVAALCAGGDTSLFRTIGVQTLCALVTDVPFVENFDGMTGSAVTSMSTNNLPTCWAYHNTGSSTNYSGYPIVYRSANTAHSGVNALRFYTSATVGTYSDQTAQLPLTDSTLLPVTALQVRFWMRSTSASYNSYVVVGIMTDPDNGDSFTPVDTVPTNGSTVYGEHTVLFSSYNGPHGRVAFRAPQPSASFNALLIDDIMLDSLPSCMPVQHLATTHATPTTVEVRWSSLGTADSWSVVYLPTGLPADSALSVTSHDTSATLTGLMPNTQYTIMVIARCSTGHSDTTTTTFETPCNYISALPYSENFDGWPGSTATSVSASNLPPCWANQNSGTNTLYSGYPIVYSSSSYAHSGANALRFYTYATAGSYSDQTVLLPLTDPATLPVDMLQVKFWMRSTSSSYNSYVVVGVVPNPDDASSFVPIDTVYTNGATSYNNYTVLCGRYGGEHGHIALRAPRPASGYNALMVDDITLDHMPPCPNVVDLEVTHTTTDSIGIKWSAMGREHEWIVSIGTDEQVTTDTTYTFGELTPGTFYTLSVRALCTATGDTSEAVTVTTHTQCGLLTVLPYRENFDRQSSYTTNTASENNLPICWANINRSQRNNYKGYPIVYNGYAHSGGNSMKFYTYYNSADSNQYAILPLTDSNIYPVNSLTLSFHMRAGNASGTYMAKAIAGVVSNPTDPRTFVAVDTITATGSTVYAEHTVDFGRYEGPHGSVALMFPQAAGSGYNYNSGYVDDIVMNVIPDCMPIANLSVLNTTAHTADLAWSDTMGIDGWTVEYGRSGFTFGTGTVVSVEDTGHGVGRILITGLAAGASYDVYVWSTCPYGEAGVAFATFSTACSTIDSLPYVENFDSYGVGTAEYTPPVCGIPCWHRLDNATQYHYGIVGNPTQWPTGARSGSGFLYYYFPPTTSNYADWLISVLPPVNTVLHPIETLQLSFWVKMDNVYSTGNIEVGVMTDPLADSTFVPVDTVSTSGIIYEHKEINLSGYGGSGAYIALRFRRNPSAISHYFVDDVKVEQIPVCTPVEYITLLDADTNALTITWSETGTSSSWRVEYGLHGFTPDSGTFEMVRTLPFTIRGLAPTTEYDIYVKPICSQGDALARMVTFRTGNLAMGMPYVCTFEDTLQNAMWALENGNNPNRWVIGTATSNGGTRSLYVSNDNGISNNYTTASADAVDYAFVTLNLTDTGDYGYSFDWKCQGESIYDFLRAALVPNSEPLTAGTFLPSQLSAVSMPASWIPLDGGHKLNLQPLWQTRTDVARIHTPGVYNMVFIFRCNSGGGATPPPAVDNINMGFSSCTRPDSVVVSNLTQTTATFAWSEMGEATEWQYRIDNGITTTVSSPNATLTGLTTNTQYVFQVRAICGEGDTSFWREYHFHTPCNPIGVPYLQDFENETTGGPESDLFASCWTRNNNGIRFYGYPHISQTVAYNHTGGGNQGLYWVSTPIAGYYGDYQMAVLPPVDTALDITTLQLSFWVKANSSSYTPVFEVGVMSDPNNVSTFVSVDTITITGNHWREVIVPLSPYQGDGRWVAIKADRAADQWYASMDDIALDFITTCFVPTMVYATGTTESSIDVDWVDITPTTEWQVEYGPQGYQQGSSAGTLLTVTSHPVTITGLNPLSPYDFYIRPICGVDDSARWGQATTLVTAICNDNQTAATGVATSAGSTFRYPVNNLYSYTLSETIVDSSELGGAMDIGYIGLYYDATTDMTAKTNCTIYLQPTTLGTFGSASDAVALDTAAAARVYTGSLNCTHGWNYFVFDTVFHYSGDGNLLVIVDDNSGSYNSSLCSFKSEPCVGNKTLIYYSDTYNPDVMNPTAFAGSRLVDTHRVVMQLVSCLPPHCHRPVVAQAESTYNSATISWTGEANTYEVNIKEESATDWPVPDIAVAGNSYTFSGLSAASHYRLRLRSDCRTDSLGYSEWVEVPIETDCMPCLPPDSITIVYTTNSSACLDWETAGNENAWDIHVWNGFFDSTYRAPSQPFTVHGLITGLTYNAAIRPICRAGMAVGDWSDTLRFTTSTCPDVTGLTVTDVTSNSVTLNWDSDPMAHGWVVEYGFNGFTQGQGMQTTSSTNTIEITDLEEGTIYDFHVKAMCGTDWASENWATVTVTTLDDAPCHSPTDVTVEISTNNAFVSWTPGEGNISFELEYGIQGFAHGEGIMIPTQSSNHMLTGLEPSTRYDVYIRGICSPEIYSDWSGVNTFSTGSAGINEQEDLICSIFPNPTTASTTISLNGACGHIRISIVDMNGRVLQRYSQNTGDIEVKDLRSGTYFVHITTNNVNMVKKLIVR